MVCLDGADLTEPELRQEVLKLRRRVQKLRALLRLALALLRTSGFRLSISNWSSGRLWELDQVYFANIPAALFISVDDWMILVSEPTAELVSGPLVHALQMGRSTVSR